MIVLIMPSRMWLSQCWHSTRLAMNASRADGAAARQTPKVDSAWSAIYFLDVLRVIRGLSVLLATHCSLRCGFYLALTADDLRFKFITMLLAVCCMLIAAGCCSFYLITTYCKLLKLHHALLICYCSQLASYYLVRSAQKNVLHSQDATVVTHGILRDS